VPAPHVAVSWYRRGAAFRGARGYSSVRRRVGLDHLAFRVADPDELQRWAAHFDAMGVTHTGILNTGYGPTLVFRDPDNIQLELYVQPVGGDMPDLSDADSAEAQRLLSEAR
jgi:glyoxylase I family protein